MKKKTEIVPFIRQYASASRRDASYKRTYRNNAEKIADYSKYIGKKLYTNSFDALTFEDYITYLHNRPEQYKYSTIQGFGQKLSHMLRLAAKRGFEVNFGFEEYSLPYEDACAISLTESEIEALFRLKKISSEAHAVRENFIIACCTGFRISDAMRLKEEDVAGRVIQVTPGKTQKRGIRVTIPVHWMIKEIVKRNKGRIPELKSPQAYNLMVKRLCRKAGITEPILYEQHHGVRLVRKTVPKYSLVSSHTARRSLATNLYLRGVQTAKIMLLTGHTTEQSFFKYIRIGQMENALDLSTHPFFAAQKTVVETPGLGEQLKKHRQAAGLSQKTIADHLGVGVQAIRSYEQGSRLPEIEDLRAIANLLNVVFQIGPST